MGAHLKKTKLKWTRQAYWGFRLFDFWCHRLGVAVEVDGPEHIRERDEERDQYNFHRSGIIVIRVRNFSEPDAAACLREISKTGPWAERRAAMDITGNDRETRRQWRDSSSVGDFLARYRKG